jgi:hypothetical protein
MISKEQLLEQLQQYEPTVKGNMITIFTTEDRSSLLKSLEKTIDDATYNPATNANMSSAGEVRVGSFRIQAKRPKGISSGSGSGAGSFITNLAESGQCFYCAAAWYESDFSTESLQRASKYVNATASLQQVMTLPDDWIHSLIATAQALNAHIGHRKYTFHRGSSYVNSIASNFASINKTFREFSNINKWTPADIWIVSEEMKSVSYNFSDYSQFNKFLLEAAEKKQLFGVSLKKTASSASVSRVNFGQKAYDTKYTGSTVGKRSFFESKDVYLFYNDGEIQFRGSPTWQGEIIGKTAKHGKISGGPVNNILMKHTRGSVDSQGNVDTQVRVLRRQFDDLSKVENGSKKEQDLQKSIMKNQFLKNFHKLYQSVTGDRKTSLEAFVGEIQGKEHNWITSKYLGAQLIDIMNKSSPQQQQMVMSAIMNYAKSQSESSAPFLKVQ